MASIEEKVENLVKEKIENLGYDLYDVEYAKEGKNYFLRIFIDKENRNRYKRLWKGKQWNSRFARWKRLY